MRGGAGPAGSRRLASAAREAAFGAGMLASLRERLRRIEPPPSATERVRRVLERAVSDDGTPAGPDASGKVRVKSVDRRLGRIVQ